MSDICDENIIYIYYANRIYTEAQYIYHEHDISLVQYT